VAVHEGRDNLLDPRDRGTSLLINCEWVISGFDVDQRAKPIGKVAEEARYYGILVLRTNARIILL